jgi:Sulfotransferase family
MTFQPGLLVAAARAATGLEDLGDDSVFEGLEALCASLDADALLNDLGVAALSGNIERSLANRLRVIDWENRHRVALQAERIVSPVVVIGMFRAGTTLMSYLLDQDARHRALLRWEATDSVPPPTPETFRSGERVDAARAGEAMMDAINPKFKAIHHEEADGPTECITLLAQGMMSLSWEAIANIGSYSDWLLGVDQRPAYAYHHQALRVLQSGGVRGRWTLKSPHHAIALDSLVAEYPDAKLVLLHRDPLVLCASVCSLIGTLSGTFTGADHRATIAHHWPTLLEASIARINAFRRARPDVAILDVQYRDLVTEPLATLATIYDFIDQDFDTVTESRVVEYLRTHPKGRFGEHRYDLEALGLRRGELEERFGSYRDQYGIAAESV